MTSIMMKLHRAAPDTLFIWHVPSLRQARHHVTKVWGHVLRACALSRIRRLASRSAGSVVGQAFRRKSVAEIATLRQLAGGHLGRGRTGRPRASWEDQCCPRLVSQA